MFRNASLAAVGLSCSLLSICCAAQGTVAVKEKPPAIYRAGMQSITVPAPADLRDTGPDYMVLFEHLVPDANRLVAAFLRPEDVQKLPSESGALVRYAFVETLRQAEFTDIDDATFKQVSEAVAKQFGTSADAPPLDVKALQEEMNHKLKAVGDAGDISLNKPVNLGTLFTKKDASGFGIMMTVGSGDKSAKVLVGVSVLRVKNRLLYTGVYAEYTGDDSTSWVRTTSEKWADAILKANP